MHSFRVRLNRIKRIPKGHVCLSLFFLVLTLCSLFSILQSQEILLRNTQEVSLTIDGVRQVGIKDRGASQYNVVSNGRSYYFTYYYEDSEGESEFRMFNQLLENHTSNEKLVMTATVSAEQTLGDIILNRHRILHFAIDGTEYLSMQTTEKHMMNIHHGEWFSFVLFSACLLVCVLFDAIAYGIIE